MIGALMLDIAGTELTQEDIALLQAPQVGGMILFGRNIESPAQVRALTDHMRRIRPDILIAVDQEGGRVQRLKQGFSLLPAMGKFGELFLSEPEKALSLAEQSGWLSPCLLAVSPAQQEDSHLKASSCALHLENCLSRDSLGSSPHFLPAFAQSHYLKRPTLTTAFNTAHSSCSS